MTRIKHINGGIQMHISRLSISGYKNTKEKSEIKLNKGLNVLVGENGSGKTTIINALRLALRENEFSYMSIDEDDFYRSIDNKYSAPEIRIDLLFESLNSDEQVTFISWCDADFKAQLHLEINANPNRKGYYKKEIWGGAAKSSIFEEETFECIDCIYLPPLRDAEEKLVNGKRSRLAQLLKKQYGDNKDTLVQSVSEFNKQITNNSEDKYNEIESAKKKINTKLEETLGQRLGQSINLQFAETTFNKIVESIKMVFFPGIQQNDPDKYRDIATNSLGYNNLLYIATVFAELELLKDNNMMTVLLIEEPEAHLHPQLQVKFIKYLEEITRKLEHTQVVITTHSPVLASSINTDNLIHIAQKEEKIIATSLKEINLGESKNYINRWLDVTKSTLLFSKGIILVEGISEAMLIPSLAKIVLARHNKDLTGTTRMLPNSLEEAGVSIININGINFKHFMKLFVNFDSSTNSNQLPIYCSGITDNDPPKTKENIYDKNGVLKLDEDQEPLFTLVDIFPLPGEEPLGANSALLLIEEINNSIWGRLFHSPLKTFEYDLAIEKNTSQMAEVLFNLWPKPGKVKTRCEKISLKNNVYDENDQLLAEDAKYIFKHIDVEEVGKGVYAQKLTDYLELQINKEWDRVDDTKSNIKSIYSNIGDVIKVPSYIEKAILWSCGGE